jgi:hypothetical protein
MFHGRSNAAMMGRGISALKILPAVRAIAVTKKQNAATGQVVVFLNVI